MRVRTVYFKTNRIDEVSNWWAQFLGREPAKKFEKWREFRVGAVNLGFLQWEGAVAGGGSGGCIPVIEFADENIVESIAKAKALGAEAILEGEDHPDYPNTAAVLVDPFGNEFEVTNYHG